VNQGPISGSQPEVFNPGFGYFDIYFDGSKLTWVVITYKGNQKTSTASDASSTSNKCNSIGNKKAVVQSSAEWKLFPNPAKEWIEIQHEEWDGQGEIMIYNVSGKEIELKESPVSVQGSVKINLSNLQNGFYFVRLVEGELQGYIKVIKE
jgi:hypothetical protein